MRVILRGLATSNERDAYGLILSKITIYDIFGG